MMPDSRTDPKDMKRRNPPHPAEYPPRIIIKFHGKLNDSDVLRYDYLLYLKNEELALFKKTFPSLKIERLFVSTTPEDILKLAQEIKERHDDYKRPLSLLTYFSIVCPESVDPKEIVQVLSQFPFVETAYIAPFPATPAVDPTPNKGFSRPQTDFLRQAPGGIDVAFAWEIGATLGVGKGLGVAGGDGGGVLAGLKFVDIEHGWMLTHDDINDIRKRPSGIGIDGVNNPPLGHGTACLGIVIASDQEPPNRQFENSSLGITPNVETVSCVSSYRSQGDPPNLYDAILFAITHKLSSGDVLLLEVYYPSFTQNNQIYYGVPVEIEWLVYTLIKSGTQKDIVIVEPAGNTDRNNNLDTFGIPQLRGGSGEDSGAIMVSAAYSSVPVLGKISNAPMEDKTGTTPFRRHSYGSRINCFAWGEDIYTTWYDPTDPADPKYASFADTSGAAAIIAGAALSVQGLAKINLGYPFTPTQLRDILSNPNPCTGGGTLSHDPPNDKIGVMPNIQNIIRKKLRLVPDVYARDFINDIGECHTGPLSMSPDIILLRNAVLDPQAAFGQGSGTENDIALSDSAIVGQPHSIYVRVRNRGPIDAINIQADVYWSEVSTLPDPNNWQLIGSATIPIVPAGRVLTVSPVISWATAPASGHYCFIAVLGTVTDPPPPQINFLSWANFERYVREENNVTWRNFDVINTALAAGREIALDFLIEGPPDQPRAMRLEIVSELPRGSEVALVVPKDGLRLVQGLGHFQPLPNNDGEPLGSIRVNPHGRSETQYTEFPPERGMKSKLLVKLPIDCNKYPYELYVRQLYHDREVGRVAWRLAPKRIG
jgi:hypothetical protein